ncbi:aquaporin-like protein [Setomelanomma holmii]|uniref:Aquaporin-like protein n=1 Tax=Setomelanomma holmii TaxID=210430 RepID=A0A9P4LQU5_9PLEO|nr:aquaporin-like protein [Setomelanomma holmii]
MAAANSSPLPQYYGQQLQDGTMMETPITPRHARGSSDSRQELLRLPMQPHQAHIDPNLDPVSPELPPNESNAIVHRGSNRWLGGITDPNDYGTPTTGRHQRRTQSQDIRGHNSYMSHRTPYVEDYASDEDYEPQPYRRRPSRQHRPPPSAYGNDRVTGRYTNLPGRGSFDTNGTYHNDQPRFHMHYGSDDEYAPKGPRRPPINPHAGGAGFGDGRGPPRRPPSTEDVLRLPWAMWMGSNAKNHFVAFVGEFVGTTMFLFFAFSGTQVANIGSSAASDTNTTTGEQTGFQPGVLLYIALVFGFSLMVNVWVFFRISGGLFNPAVTFAMLLCRALSPVRAFLLLAAQIAGAIFSSYLVSILFPTDFNVRTTLSTGTSLAQGVFIEAMLTFELVFTIFMLAKEKHKATFIAPVGIGLALFIAELVGVYYTGGSLNPARSFGPCVVTGIFDREHWIYWVGPAVGAIFAVVFYKVIKILEYEVANPGQDNDDKEEQEKEVREKSAEP